jgi:hypothetical protein
MKTQLSKPIKVRATLAITKEAQDVMLDNGYASVRTMGVFISQLIMDYHARQTRAPTKQEIAAELRRLADMLEAVNQVAPMPDKPMPLANVIDAPSDMVGVTVISEESSAEGE